MNQFANMTLDEMLDLNKVLCEAIRAKRSAESANKILMFAPGDLVMVKGWGKTAGFKAVVQKALKVNVDVTSTVDGRNWRIPAHMLSHVQKVTA
jgi:hypothetical protein